MNTGQSARRSATRRRGTTFVPATRVVPITERQAAESFAAVVLRMEAGDLATAAHRTKEAAKMWKAGRRCPNGSSLINLARTIPAVREWLLDEIDSGAAEANSSNAMTAVIAGLQAVASQPTPEGAAARALLSSIVSGGA